MNKLIKKQIEEVSSAMSRTNELYDKWAKARGLNYNSLMVLYTMEGKNNCTQKQICDEWMIPKQTVSTICNNFKDKGYVFFEPDPEDKRGKIVKFTQSGLLYSNAILNDLHKIEIATMKNMGQDMCHWFVKSNKLFCDLFEIEVNNDK